MAYKIIWSPEAEKTFDEVIEYLQNNWTKKEIKNFIKKTEEIILILHNNPYLFRGSEKVSIYEALIGKQNLLIYQINESKKKVELLNFWDTRQNPKGKFEK